MCSRRKLIWPKAFENREERGNGKREKERGVSNIRFKLQDCGHCQSAFIYKLESRMLDRNLKEVLLYHDGILTDMTRKIIDT